MTALYVICGIIALAGLLFLIVLFLIAAKGGNSAAMRLADRKYYAHRGLHGGDIPENSIAAFKRAIAAGYGSELDIHLTKDKRLAVMHDESLQRMCGSDALVGELTYDELSSCRLAGTDQKIPLFEEVLALYNGEYPLIIELKTYRNNGCELAAAAMRLLHDYSGEYCIESFDPRPLRWLKKHEPDVVRGQLSADLRKSGAGIGAAASFVLSNLFANVLSRPHFIAYSILDRRASFFRLVLKLFKPALFYWTVRNEDEQAQAEADGGAIIFEGFDPRK